MLSESLLIKIILFLYFKILFYINMFKWQYIYWNKIKFYFSK